MTKSPSPRMSVVLRTRGRVRVVWMREIALTSWTLWVLNFDLNDGFGFLMRLVLNHELKQLTLLATYEDG
jgi:hypothetical protein